MKKDTNEPLELLSWGSVRKKNILMFQTLRGPMMGHFDKVPNTNAVRVYAPAMVTMPNASNVVFLPVAFVEHHMDLYLATVMGTNLPPEVVLKGYAGYFEQFIKGGYAMTPLVVRAGIEGTEHSVELPVEMPAPDPDVVDETITEVETCPGCQATVADWQDHYPVFVESSNVALSMGLPSHKWTCELRFKELRTMFPSYEPPHPSTVSP